MVRLTFIVDDGDDSFGDSADLSAPCRRRQLHLEVGLLFVSLGVNKRHCVIHQATPEESVSLVPGCLPCSYMPRPSDHLLFVCCPNGIFSHGKLRVAFREYLFVSLLNV